MSHYTIKAYNYLPVYVNTGYVREESLHSLQTVYGVGNLSVMQRTISSALNWSGPRKNSCVHKFLTECRQGIVYLLMGIGSSFKLHYYVNLQFVQSITGN